MSTMASSRLAEPRTPSRWPWLMALLTTALTTAIVLWLLWRLLRIAAPAAPAMPALDDDELVILTRNAPTTIYESRDGFTGPEYDLVVDFARFLGRRRIRFKFFAHEQAVIAALTEKQGHLAAGLSPSSAATASFTNGPSYRSVFHQVVCGDTIALPQELDALQQVRLAVVRNSRQEQALSTAVGGEPYWQQLAALGTEDLLAAVARGEYDCTVADSHVVAINRRYHPQLRVAFSLEVTEQLAWLLAPDAEALLTDLEDWSTRLTKTTLLMDIENRYYSHIEAINRHDVAAFTTHVKERLPRFRSLFENNAQRHGLSWTLLAALAYQESLWDANARSPTGVRGLMMLTQRTARAMGVSNRLDPTESVAGGARYLKRLLGRIDDEVATTDRLWFALAAYNVGLGHVEDARKLARRLGYDANRWQGVQQALPLLSEPSYYQSLDHGYAQGQQPVDFVRHVRNFRDMLRQRFPADTQLSATTAAGVGQ